MSFNSLRFLVFFPVVVLVYYIIPKRVKSFWLLLASYFFYGSWDARFLLLLLYITAVTYGGGLLLAPSADGTGQKRGVGRKAVLTVTVILSLATLFFFKYYLFTAAILRAIVQRLSIPLHIPLFDILLPVGISFFTFQAIGYIVDVYRGDIPAERNFLRYALFVSFFPQLVAGPIERSRNLLGQLEQPRRFDFDRAKDGLLQMLWGFFLKLVIADRIALFVDTVYGNVGKSQGMPLLIATVLFAFQLYCDFYGYSSIACGAAEILGIRLMENFKAPYFSRSVAELWQNWHISLTSWFRDYVYIPLGGNRKGKGRTLINKLIVFLLSGLWHGASFSFVVWGGLNALYLILGDMLKPVRDKLVRRLGLHRESFGHRLVCCFWTFVLYDFSLIFFRSRSLHNSVRIACSVLTTANPWVLIDGSLLSRGLDAKDWTVLLIALLILFVADWQKHRGIRVREFITRQDAWFQIVVIVFSVCAILVFGIWGPEYSEANFVYFQF